MPGTWDGLELAIRAVLGQQITVGAAIKLAGKLVAQYGAPLTSARGNLTHVFPEAAVLAAADLATLGMPKSRGRTLSGVAQALLDDPLLFEPGRQGGVARLLALYGIGDWTAQYIALRQLREMDGLPNGDVGLINALAALEGGPVTARQLLARAEGWRPYRGYAAQLLWTSLSRQSESAFGRGALTTGDDLNATGLFGKNEFYFVNILRRSDAHVHHRKRLDMRLNGLMRSCGRTDNRYRQPSTREPGC